MSYRSDRAALQARRRSLTLELEALGGLRREEARLREELTRINLYLNAERTRLPVLRGPRIPTPCTVPWDSMRGDARARRCGECRKNVFDLSAMTAEDAAALLAQPGDLCVRFYERPDGTVVTADCPEPRWQQVRRIAGGAVVVGTLAVTTVIALTWGAPDRPYPNRPVDQVALNPALLGKRLRVEGTLVPGSLQKTETDARFSLASPSGALLRVVHPPMVRGGTAILPDGFVDVGVPFTVVVDGELEPDGTFTAHSLFARGLRQGYVMKDHDPAGPTGTQNGRSPRLDP